MKNKHTRDLYTALGEQICDTPWNVYPRPQMVRNSFFSLNGEWEFSSNGYTTEKITVPFAPESLLSGIHRYMGSCPELYYKKEFSLPEDFNKGRVILHFGAVDQCARVVINGTSLETHFGGYLPFSFDITEYINDKNTVEVYVTDHLDAKILPYGKQCRKRGGMWYTPISGIWQTVWLESVPKSYIKDISVTVGADFADIETIGAKDGYISLLDKEYPLCNGKAHIKIDSPHLWSPSDPFLYRFEAVCGEDRIKSYFALRTIEAKEVDGISRLCLNGKPFFFHGLLDQGYFSDGIFTPSSSEEYENDILTAKSLGFNTLRKHIKIEPEVFYYLCDKHGMIVFQDMVNNGSYSFLRDTALPTLGLKRKNDRRTHKNKHSRKAFTEEMIKTVKHLKNHPCICYWTIFNEGWGQFLGSETYKTLKEIDATRPIDTASGWFVGCDSDIESPHVYFNPFEMQKSDKPVVLSEFGGYAYKIPDHSYNLKKTYGYKILNSREEFTDALEALYKNEIIPAKNAGLSGAIYTQLSDVEDETNGFVTYDRKVCKVDKERMLAIAKALEI